MTRGTTPHEIAPGATLSERNVRARTRFRDVANRIHDDEGARPPIAGIRHAAISSTGPGGRGRGYAMSDVAYVSKVRIERVKGPLRRAYLPAEPEPVFFGVHGAVAKHYGVDMEGREAHATTLDYVVAAAAG